MWALRSGSASYGLAVYGDDISLRAQRLLQDGKHGFRHLLPIDDGKHPAYGWLGGDLSIPKFVRRKSALF